MLTAFLLLAAAPAAGPSGAVPGAPVQGPVEHLRERVVEAIRNCPKPKGDEIVVCAKDKGYAESYRLPKLDPRFERGGGPAEGATAALAGAGAAGQGSCTNTVAAGSTGCGLRDYRAWGRDKKARKAQGTRYPW